MLLPPIPDLILGVLITAGTGALIHLGNIRSTTLIERARREDAAKAAKEQRDHESAERRFDERQERWNSYTVARREVLTAMLSWKMMPGVGQQLERAEFLQRSIQLDSEMQRCLSNLAALLDTEACKLLVEDADSVAGWANTSNAWERPDGERAVTPPPTLHALAAVVLRPPLGVQVAK